MRLGEIVARCVARESSGPARNARVRKGMELLATAMTQAFSLISRQLDNVQTSVINLQEKLFPFTSLGLH